jgi:NitT/TauT family transport system substrate-binding protein
MPIVQSRRRLLTNLALAGAAGLGGVGAAGLGRGRASLAAEPAPEITTIRIEKDPDTCGAPTYVADDLLRAEGFQDIRFVEESPTDILKGDVSYMLADGKVDIGMDFPPYLIRQLDVGKPATALAGIHSGCMELFAKEDIRSVAELKGRTVAFRKIGVKSRLVAMIASYVGLDPAKDIRWVNTNPSIKPMQLFIEGKLDAFLAIQPEPQQLRALGFRNVVVNMAMDRPWSQYFCCMLVGNPDFIRKYPVATKRAVRAILKATDLCASEPQHVAQLMVERGFADRYDHTVQALTEIPYTVWRDLDPEDTMRFFALRMREAGLSNATPQEVIARTTDWRFFNELKRELKV